ncbi:hypothetical protein OAP55_00070 [Alphaproteobacteria bacterium]|nr:hypothetical protein [Alphaproteobacteria bacterium]
MKNILIYYFINYIKNFFILSILASLVLGCSLAEFYSEEPSGNIGNEINKLQNTNYIKVKCPTTIIPKATSKYSKYNDKKSLFVIESTQIICKELLEKDGKFALLVDYKVNINSVANFKMDKNYQSIPQIYIAVIDKRNQIVLTKILAKTSSGRRLKANQPNKIINKGKVKINHVKELTDISLYIGFQMNLSRSNRP